MPAKPSKPRKSRATKAKVPADQLPLKTQCGFCEETFANPTVAAHHLDTEHPGEYQ